MAFLDARLRSGIEAILELCDFKEHLSNTDLIITGEGKLDSQSFSGKVLSGILNDAGNVPVISICGIMDCDDALLQKYNIRVYEISEGITPLESMNEMEKYLRITVKRFLSDM